MILSKHILSLLKKIFYPNRSRTVRYAFPVVLSAMAFLGALSIGSIEESYIYIESDKSSIRSGETFLIKVYVSAHTPVNAVDISLQFPQEQIEINGIDTGESVITLWTVDPYVENGTVILRGGTFRKGFRGNHLIATINAQAVETGLAQFNISDSLLLAGDGSGSEVRTTSTGLESTKLYIANEDGTFIQTESEASTIQGSVEVIIVTDIDGDGSVTLNDLSRFMSAWRSKTYIFDFNGDGRMSFRDFGIILYDSFIK